MYKRGVLTTFFVLLPVFIMAGNTYYANSTFEWPGGETGTITSQSANMDNYVKDNGAGQVSVNSSGNLNL